MKQVAPLVLASSFLLSPFPASAQTLSLTGGVNFTSVATETGLSANPNFQRNPDFLTR